MWDVIALKKQNKSGIKKTQQFLKSSFHCARCWSSSLRSQAFLMYKWHINHSVFLTMKLNLSCVPFVKSKSDGLLRTIIYSVACSGTEKSSVIVIYSNCHSTLWKLTIKWVISCSLAYCLKLTNLKKFIIWTRKILVLQTYIKVCRKENPFPWGAH